MKLGDKLEKLINIITFGYGKTIATKVANKLGYEDCGCERRKNQMNKFTINGITRNGKETK